MNQSWSVPLGIHFGVPWRAHVLLLVGAGLVLGSGWVAQRTAADSDLFILSLQIVLVSALSLLCHEILQAALAAWWKLPGSPVLLGPLGNMCGRQYGQSPRRDAVVAAVGPLTHFALGTIALLVCVAIGRYPSLSWFNLVTPPDIEGRWELSQIAPLFWVINWGLGLIQLLPINPLDGHALAIHLIRTFQPDIHLIWAGFMIRHLSLLIGAVCIGLASGAWFWSDGVGLLPDWVLPGCIAVLLIWSALADLSLAVKVIPTTSGEGVAKPESPARSSKSSKRPNRKPRSSRSQSGESESLIAREMSDEDFDRLFSPASDAKTAASEAKSEERSLADMDDILRKLHEVGPDGLTEREKQVLLKASEALKKRKEGT